MGLISRVSSRTYRGSSKFFFQEHSELSFQKCQPWLNSTSNIALDEGTSQSSKPSRLNLRTPNSATTWKSLVPVDDQVVSNLLIMEMLFSANLKRDTFQSRSWLSS